jgi:hypothetical protein
MSERKDGKNLKNGNAEKLKAGGTRKSEKVRNGNAERLSFKDLRNLET